MRRRKGLPSFRSERAHRVLRQAVRDARREGFRITHYSIQNDHLHIIVEAESDAALTRGMRSFTIRVALRLNRDVLARDRGRVWGDRYHRRDLTGPRAVRNALVYVLSNHLKHGEYDVGLLDPFSSGAWFTGWAHGPDPPISDDDPSPAARATTWVLREGWYLRGGGRIHLGEVPRAR
jgi:REP element-mobilizing transposase RayT